MAGRTDAGVHAAGQVASFVTSRSAESMPAHRWISGLNHFLPQSAAVQDAVPTNDAFDPRRDALSRTYTYVLRVSNRRQPLWVRRAWIVPPPFDHEMARAALSILVGDHDFAAFTPPTEARSTSRTLHEATLAIGDHSCHISVRADSFLQHQVRRMVGAVVEVARGRVGLEELMRQFERARPGSMGPTAPACGLSLTAVEYQPPLFDTHMFNHHHCP